MIHGVNISILTQYLESTTFICSYIQQSGGLYISIGQVEYVSLEFSIYDTLTPRGRAEGYGRIVKNVTLPPNLCSLISMEKPIRLSKDVMDSWERLRKKDLCHARDCATADVIEWGLPW